MQFDADTVGSASMAADAEVCMMIADTMEELGIPRGSYVVKVNNRKVFDGIREVSGITSDAQWLTALRAIDKLDRLGVDEVEKLLRKGRKDESGDFTKGADLSDAAITRIINFTGWGARGSGSKSVEAANSVTLANFETAVEGSSLGEAGVAELSAIIRIAEAAGYDETKIVVDPSVVRGLEYYTGPVFEVELTFPVEGDDGKPVRFGSVAGGGRYDGLVGRFRGENTPATGISIGVSRLMAALQHLKKVETSPEPGPVVVTVFDSDRIADYQKMVAALRSAGIRAELYLGTGKFGAQMKYADKRGSPCAVIQGGDEKAKGEVQIKDLILGATISDIKDRDEYLKAKADSQFAIAEDALVDGVRKVLARHGVKWE
jgi:histidyl-tRNA synthetase